jgi:hypothetical protein
VYLWALEKNEPARRFYDKLGGHVAEIVDSAPSDRHPGVRSCRYVWPSAGSLHDACRALTGDSS